MKPFDLYIGIDWSGSKGKYQRGIAVSEAKSGKKAPYPPPELIEPPNGRARWSRTFIYEYLSEKIKHNQRILVGLDFAFAHPFFYDCDQTKQELGKSQQKGSSKQRPARLKCPAYYPKLSEGKALTSPQKLWAKIDSLSPEANFYGGGVWENKSYSAYYCTHKRRGKLYHFRRRETEYVAMCMKNGRCPSITFKAIGPDDVGTGSMAGMRFLHSFVKEHGKKSAIWPFDTNKIKTAQIVFVEIFPTLYFRLGEIKKSSSKMDMEAMNQALRHYKSKALSKKIAINQNDGDAADALISAASIRSFAESKDENYFSGIDSKAATKEGWIFGVLI